MLANVVLFLLWFWSILHSPATEAMLGRLAGDPRSAPWSMLTFGLLEPSPLFAWGVAGDFALGLMFVLCLVFVFWLGGDLERNWGSWRYAGFLAGTSAVSYLVVFTFTGHRLTGPAPLLANLIMAWLTFNSEYQLRVMFMFTLSLGFFRWVTLGLVLLSTGFYAKLIPGLSALAGPLLSWWWSGRIRPLGERPRFQVIEGGYEEDEDEDEEEEQQLRWENSEVDRILDKIRVEGMSSLTVQERELLDSVSRQLRRS